MSRSKVNSGWLFITDTDTLNYDTEGIQTQVMRLVTGEDLREGIAAVGLALDNADYYVERMLLWGEMFYNPNNIAQSCASMTVVRVGTFSADTENEVTSNLLFTETNTELWGRVLQDTFVPTYRFPQWTMDGAALAVNSSPTADGVLPIFPMHGPMHFALDIQQRFSLQRQEDNLNVAFSPHPEYAVDGDTYTLTIAAKLLVKEYRR